MINHYRILGVDPGAEAVVIRSAYLALIRRYHPDKGGEEADPLRAQEITAAWEVLRDPGRRAAYDEARKARFHPGAMSAAAAAAAAAAAGTRVRGGALGRNLFILLAAGTVGLGWWALQQPQPQPQQSPAIAAQETEPALPPGSMRAIEEEELRAARRIAAANLPPPPVVRREPEIDAPVELPRLPDAAPPRLPVRAAQAEPSSRREPAVERTRPAAASPRPDERQAAAVAAPASSPAASSIDLAPLERHLQLLTDQSLRFGTEAKRARLFASREGFLKKLRDCDSDACKRDAYLRRNVEVGEIMRN